MSHQTLSDEAVVERARRAFAGRRKVRWWALLNAVFYLGFCGYLTIVGIHKIEALDADQLNKGFIFGLALAVVWTSFGVIGALFLGKALIPFSGDFRTQELLIKYHDCLRDLGRLPDEKDGEPDGADNSHRAGQ